MAHWIGWLSGNVASSGLFQKTSEGLHVPLVTVRVAVVDRRESSLHFPATSGFDLLDVRGLRTVEVYDHGFLVVAPVRLRVELWAHPVRGCQEEVVEGALIVRGKGEVARTQALLDGGDEPRVNVA